MKLKRKDKTTVYFSGPRILNPKRSGVYKAIETPLLKSFELGDVLIIDCKGTWGKRLTFKFVYEGSAWDVTLTSSSHQK